jgi:hypothetical protein
MPARTLGALLAVSLSFGSLTACGKSAPPPPVDDTRLGSAQSPAAPMAPTPHTGVTTTQKVVLLAGAAALYYLYKHHQTAATQTGPEGQYYLSKNGRVYYRDAEHRAHWVTPPPEGVRVPESEAHEYRQFQGYDGSTNGRDLAGLSSDE